MPEAKQWKLLPIGVLALVLASGGMLPPATAALPAAAPHASHPFRGFSVTSSSGLTTFQELNATTLRVVVHTAPTTLVSLYLQSTASTTFNLAARRGEDGHARYWYATLRGFRPFLRCGEQVGFAASSGGSVLDGEEDLSLTPGCRSQATYVTHGQPLLMVSRVDASHLQLTLTDVDGEIGFRRIEVNAGRSGVATLRGKGSLTSGAFWVRTVGGFTNLPRCVKVRVKVPQDASATLRPGCHGLTPTRPRDVSAAPLGSTAVTVAWNPPASNGGRRIKHYLVIDGYSGQRRTCGGAVTGCTLPEPMGVDKVHTSIVVIAVNAVGYSDAGVSARLLAAASRPSAARITSVNAGTRRVTVSWVRPTRLGGTAILGYTVTAIPGGKRCHAASAVSCTVLGLAPGKAYRFAVTARNRVGPGSASAVSRPVVPTR